MHIKQMFKKQKIARMLNPKDWICEKSRLVHITTHLYNGEKFFLNNDIARYVKVTMFKIAAMNNIDILKVGCDYTHCHFLINQDPDQDLRKMVNILKGKTSREVRKRYYWLNEFSHFWAKGFYVTFYKESKKDKVFKYINNQTRELHEANVPPL